MAWPNKRMGINLTQFSIGALINMARGGNNLGQYGTSWSTGTMWDKDSIDDTTGFPNTSACRTRGWGSFGMDLPPSSEYTGPYLFKWTGSGRFQVVTGTWTVDPVLSQGSYTVHSNGLWSATNGFIVATYSGVGSAVSSQFALTDLSSTNNYITDLLICRYEDYSRHQAGYIFREKHLEQYLDYGFVRFLNWARANASNEMRFEHRMLPGQYGWGGGDFLRNDTYGEITGSNQYAIANSADSPVAMQHGEKAQGRVTTGLVRCFAAPNSSKNIISITKANPGVVTTTGAHGFLTGDKIIHSWGSSAPSGMTQLRDVPCTITVLSTTTYSLGIDTTSFSAHRTSLIGNSTAGSVILTGFASTADVTVGMTATGTGIPNGKTVSSKTSTTVTLSGSTTGITTTVGTTYTFAAPTTMRCDQNITLNRGGLGDYPVIWNTGIAPAGQFSNSIIPSAGYVKFTFDKNMVANTGKTGCWLISTSAGSTPEPIGVPLEVQTKFMVELREMQVARGKPPSDMWYTSPLMGMLSVDPDYDADSNWPVNAVDIILNGNGAWPGLPAECMLWVESSNETWNASSTSFAQAYYCQRAGWLRYGTSTSDHSSYHTVRAMQMVKELKAAYPSHPQLKYVMAGQGSTGYASGNATRISGNANVDGDAWNTWGGDPITHVDAWAVASYFSADNAQASSFFDVNGATLAAAYAAATTDKEREAICKQYIDGYMGIGAGLAGTGISFSQKYYLDKWDVYITPVAAAGKFVMNYEGGWDQTVNTYTAEINAFLVACKRSFAHAAATQYYLKQINAKANAYFPSDYIILDYRWGHGVRPTLPAVGLVNGYLNGVENAGLDKAYTVTGEFNQGKERFRRTFTA